MREPYIGDPGDEHVHPVNLTWYRDDEGYIWPSPAEGRVLVDSEDDETADRSS